MGRGAAAVQTLSGSIAANAVASPKVFSRSERAIAFGIDCPEFVEWKHWQAGGEYTRTFVVKNVSKKSQRLKYKLPATKYFSMEFPEPINLSPGMSQTVTITFRPVRLEPYDDYIEFVSIPHGVSGFGSGRSHPHSHSFFIPVRAKLPVVSLTVPNSLEFGYCAVRDSVVKDFVLTNDGDLECSYNWKVTEPFSIEPPTGSLQPGESQTVTVTFFPLEVSVYVANAVCVVLNNNYSVGCSIKGVGKFPFITLSKNDVNFGDAYVGRNAVETVRLFNHSLVKTSFATKWIVKDSGNLTTNRAFTVSPKQGSLTPGSFMDFRISFTPTTTGTFSSESVAIATPGGNTVLLNLVGNAIGPDVSFNIKNINFGNVKLGESVGRVLYLENSSEVGIKFSLLAELNGKVYSFDKTKGEVEPYTSTFINVKFTPNTPSNYFKRIICLVSNRAPLFVDLIGTGFNEKRHPPPLLAQHIDAYYERIKLGLPLIPKNTSTSVDDDQERLLQTKLNDMKISEQSAESDEVAKNTFVSELESWERVFKGVDPAKAIELDDDELDFGTCSRLKLPEYKTLTVRNNTRVKITCFWATPKLDTAVSNSDADASVSNQASFGAIASSNTGGSASQTNTMSSIEESVFHVFPDESDVAPGGSTSFRVSFRPGKDRSYYSSVLECFAYVKTMRNFRLVNDMSKVCAPWNLSATAWGHTYGPGDEEFMPKASFSNRRIQFSGCHKGERTFLTTSLVNHGDTPVKFEFQYNSNSSTSSKGVSRRLSDSGVYELRPRCGVIGAKDFSLIAMSFEPTEAREYLEKINCSLNNGKANVELQVFGVGYVPDVSVLPTSSVSFRPTCLGSVTRRRVSLYNRSAITVIYEWELCLGSETKSLSKSMTNYRDVFSVEPKGGIIRGNETIDVDWLFMPTKTKHYHGRVRCNFRPAFKDYDKSRLLYGKGKSESNVSSVDVKLHGEGTVGVVTFDPPLLDFGAIAVGLSSKKQLTMYNHSSGNVHYQLQVTDLSESASSQSTSMESSITLPDVFNMQLVPSSKNTSITQPSKKIATDFIKVDQLNSLIPARSSKTINIDLLPEFSKMLHYRLSMTMSDLASMTSVDLSSMRCPSVEVTAVAQYAMLCITNAYCNSLAKSYLWRQLKLNSLNKALSQPLSEAELLLNTNNIATPVHTNTSSNSANDCVTEAVFNLGANLVGSTTTVILLEFTNTSKVTLDWQFIFQNDQEVEMENWVDVPEPQSDYEAAQNFIAENKIFEVSPKIVKMEPGARCTVEMRYKHDFVGFHEMPMLLKVERGKRIRLTLQGHTRDYKERSVQLLGLTQRLSPVLIGEQHPPTQSLLLRNDGPTRVSFNFGLESLKKLREDNYNFDVLKVLNPSGTIEPGANSYVNVLFRPLERREYTVKMSLKLKDGPEYEVELKGQGLDDTDCDAPQGDDRQSSIPYPSPRKQLAPARMRSVLDLAGFSPYQSLHIPNSFATLSHDHVDFGNAIPTHATVRRCILLRNVLSTHSLSFSWSTNAFMSDLVNGSISIEPLYGRIEPLGCMLVKLTYSASSVPAQMDTDVTCRVLPEMGEIKSDVDDVEDLDDDAFNRNNSVDAGRKAKVYRKSLENRKSVVDSSTISMRNKFPRVFNQNFNLEAFKKINGASKRTDGLKRQGSTDMGGTDGNQYGDISMDANNENIDSINSGDVSSIITAGNDAKSIIVGQSNSNNNNSNSDSIFVDDSDDKSMTMTLNLGISGSTIHRSSIPQNELFKYLVPQERQITEDISPNTQNLGASINDGATPALPDDNDLKEILFETIQDVILDCIGDVDVRQALEGEEVQTLSTTGTRSSLAPSITTKPFVPYYSQIKQSPKKTRPGQLSITSQDASSDGGNGEQPIPPEELQQQQQEQQQKLQLSERSEVLNSEDFRSFLDFVIDNAIFGLLQESAANLWRSN